MKKLVLSSILFISLASFGQITFTDTLAIQDFDSIPTTPHPAWTFTGPVIYNTMGMTGTNAAPANSPTGIGGSRSWETTTNSTGLVLTFGNITIPPGYDSIRVHFNLAAMNLISTGGGPDNLDYVLTEVSTDGGATYYGRLRIRGAVANNSYWPFSATGVARVYYQPQTEVVFAPANTGLQTNEGYSNCEIVFPGSVTQVAIRMTGRSSSSTDSWLVDNLVITGEYTSGVSVEELSGSGLKALYPNPATDQVTVWCEVKGEFRLVDMLGNEVIRKDLGSGEHSISVAELPEGMYLWSYVSGDGRVSSGKLVLK
ncbi:MAG: T9SS type A sorting domain-containing protein [Bacteroidota bacterium]